VNGLSHPTDAALWADPGTGQPCDISASLEYKAFSAGGYKFQRRAWIADDW